MVQLGGCVCGGDAGVWWRQLTPSEGLISAKLNTGAEKNWERVLIVLSKIYMNTNNNLFPFCNS